MYHVLNSPLTDRDRIAEAVLPVVIRACAQDHVAAGVSRADLFAERAYAIADAMLRLTGIDVPNDGYILVFVETTRPYAVNLKPVDAGAIWKGRALNRKAIRIAAECFKTGDWPSYPDSGSTALPEQPYRRG